MRPGDFFYSTKGTYLQEFKKTQESSRDNTFISELRTVLTFESTLLMSGLEAPAPSMDSYRTSVMLALISDEFIILLSSKIIVPTSPTYGTKNS